jgi:hypothetical protein
MMVIAFQLSPMRSLPVATAETRAARARLVRRGAEPAGDAGGCSLMLLVVQKRPPIYKACRRRNPTLPESAGP